MRREWLSFLLVLLLGVMPLGLLFWCAGVWAGDDLESLRASLVIEQLKETSALMKWIIGGGGTIAAGAIAFLFKDILASREKSREEVKVLAALVERSNLVLAEAKEEIEMARRDREKS